MCVCAIRSWCDRVLSEIMKRPAASTAMVMPKKMKKPSGAHGDDDDEQRGALNSQVADWTKGTKGCSPESSPSHSRDKGKGEKFSKMQQQGAIPEFATELCNHPPKGESKRQFRTQIINKLFVRKGSSLELCTDDAVFIQAKAAYEKRYHIAEEEGYTRLVFCGRFFANNEARMQQAIDEGEVTEETGKCGTKFYNFKKQVKGLDRGVVTENRTEGKKSLTARDYSELSGLMDELKWSYKLASKDKKALDQGKIPPAVEKMIEEAMAVQEKLSKQALCLATKSSSEVPEDKLKDLKKGHMTAKKHHSTLQHILSFKESENHEPVTSEMLDKILLQVATDTAQLNRDVEMAKGSVRSNKN